VKELKNEILDPLEAEGYAIWKETLSEYFKWKYELMVEKGRVDALCDIILNNYPCRFDEVLPERLEKKIDEINFYPALKEIQLAILKSSSPVAFERQVDVIAGKYAEEIKALNSKKCGRSCKCRESTRTATFFSLIKSKIQKAIGSHRREGRIL